MKTGAPAGRSPRRALLACAAGMQGTAAATALRRAGVEVIRAGCGPDAAAQLSQGPPDMVLLDWSLGPPGADALCRLLREEEGPEDYAYVLMLVPAGERAAAQAALAAGADDILAVPFEAVELQARVSAGLRLLDMADRVRASKREVEAALAQLRSAQAAMEADLSEARRLQQGLIGPRRVNLGAVTVSLLLRPAGHVGGDLVGLFPINGHRIATYAVDVCGSGVAAALLAARVAAHLSPGSGENLALRLDEHDLYDARPPVEVARLFNRLMLEEVAGDSYFTMVYVDLDTLSGRGRLVQAGHPHPMLQHPDGRIEVLGRGGLPVGVLPQADWEEVGFVLEPGARLFLGSDGITDAVNPEGVQLGEEGLTAILRTNTFLSGEPLLESLCWSVAQFTRGQGKDDISAVLLEREAPPP
ncbi:SpoIIE family protein phosphatase [Paracoccus sp. S-4012]|uniref:PP2C family protein-serine/threonine phosphatase n=1 Tax=Paracoccus sp. S-4012 TaxID=2665648 RepID=UPI0012B0F96B|nr:fused response regulator/phosphatase [Paracoccus sp. S-4012]MRX49290.1 SpoIIE family protein phosphatase [Paracoccus sp. S-4012]